MQRDPRQPGRPLSGRALRYARSVEAYLRAGGRPRWMERILEIDRGVAREKQRLAEAYEALQAEYAGDEVGFARRWRAHAQSCRFDALNELITRHNEWYPIERNLPMNPRTGDYVTFEGRSYRRPVLGPEWVLEHFPPVLSHDA